jgi:hypothetical protein
MMNEILCNKIENSNTLIHSPIKIHFNVFLDFVYLLGIIGMA